MSHEGIIDDVKQEGIITVTFRDIKRKFKRGSTPACVLKHMAREFPPHGVLLHAGDEGLVVVSQEESLSQTEYIYKHPNVQPSDGINLELLNAVLKLQVVKNHELVTYGSAVVFSKQGLCLTANHCLKAAQVRINTRSLRVGGHLAKVVAQNEVLDVACLEIIDGNGKEFDFIPFDTYYKMMNCFKIHLISYPIMADEFTSTPTITHGQVCNVAPNSQYILGDYASFPNSSGGAIICDNKLVGIHVESTYVEEPGKETTMKTPPKMIEWLELNLQDKGMLGVFVGIIPIQTFLLTNKIIPRFGVSTLPQTGRPKMAITKQTGKEQLQIQSDQLDGSGKSTKRPTKKPRRN